MFNVHSMNFGCIISFRSRVESDTRWTSLWCTLGWKTTTHTAIWESWRAKMERDGSPMNQMTSGKTVFLMCTQASTFKKHIYIIYNRASNVRYIFKKIRSISRDLQTSIRRSTFKQSFPAWKNILQVIPSSPPCLFLFFFSTFSFLSNNWLAESFSRLEKIVWTHS